MPKFDRPPKKPKPDTPATRPSTGQIIEARCHTCTHVNRKAIDRMIALGTPYAEISRMFSTEERPIDRRSISRHSKEHLNYEDAAIRRIIEEEAQSAEADLEEGIQGALKRRVLLNVAVQKALEGVLTGETPVELRDALAAAQLLDKLETQTQGAALDEIRLQFSAFVQAIREVCPPDLHGKILERTKEIYHLAPVAQINEQSEAS